MKRFIINFFGFTGFGILLYVVLLILAGLFMPKSFRNNLPYNLGGNGNSFNRFKEADTTHNLDVLVLGSSHAYRGYDPRIFKKQGYKFFNLGTSAQTSVQMLYLLKRYIHQFNPKLIIVDSNPGLFNSDGVESTVDLISNSKMDEALLDMGIKENDIRVYNTLIYAYFRSVFHLNDKFKEKEDKNSDDKYISGGYVESNQVYRPSKLIRKGSKYIIAPEQMVAFKKVIDVIKANKISYILIQAPIPVARYQSIANNATVDSSFAKLGDYINSNKLLSLPNDYFLDDSHLNQKGVEIFDKIVIDEIAKGKVNPLAYKR